MKEFFYILGGMSAAYIVWIIYRAGKNSNELQVLKKASEARNDYIKDVEKIVAKEREINKMPVDINSVDDVVRMLKAVGSDAAKTNKTGPSS